MLLLWAALSVLLLRPLCEASLRHMTHADEAATCCSSASQAIDPQLTDLLPVEPGAKAPAALAVFSFLFLAIAGFLARVPVPFTSVAPTWRSYCVRSPRILR